MLRSLRNSETTNIRGATKPCQRPSQKPATPPCSLAVPLDGLGPDAHPARTPSTRRTTTSKIKKDFMGNTSRSYVLRSRGRKSLRRPAAFNTRELVAAVNRPYHKLAPSVRPSAGVLRVIGIFGQMTITTALPSETVDCEYSSSEGVDSDLYSPVRTYHFGTDVPLQSAEPPLRIFLMLSHQIEFGILNSERPVNLCECLEWQTL